MPDETMDRGEVDLAGLARGEPSALAAIMREHQAMVFSLALHFLREPSLAEDVAQEVFLQLYQNRAAIESADHLRFWLRRTACHRALDAVRRKSWRSTVGLEDAPEPAAPDATGDPLLRARLWKLIGGLPEKQRMVLILRFQEDMTNPEIAAAMEIPVNTVKSSMARGLAFMREKLTRSMGGVCL